MWRASSISPDFPSSRLRTTAGRKTIIGRSRPGRWRRTGRSSEVAAAIENALKATSPKCLPDLATTHYRAGMAMQALGNMSEAKEHFRRAVEFDPHGRRGTLAKAALQETAFGATPRFLALVESRLHA